MQIRTLQVQDLEAVSAVCMKAFMASVAESLSEEGIATFTKVAASDAFFERMSKDTHMLVALIKDEIVGVAELREGHHVSMLFVRPDHQRHGIGTQLLDALLLLARSPKITVSASLSSIAAYHKYGFIECGDINEIAGLVYQPMDITLPK
ncbi:putative N-acetyltransferase YafP [Marinomonas gallaica]|uniref:N-acetyltransferase YafP n=1 Tax=Marinomonas gallaica TaxID=1806667 RepID=A0A1C3JLR5_9GAMM|nr:GNAT family N-acetyltransferase [Marinomonas gallaica]SBT16037.1 putative N-acetyltransferase YafP [Marinomonas gallaica]SBT21085.1 putative N-acetyltransferase YafP [Marinomonas gallaica]